MDHVGKSAHTDHGLGTITEVDTVRGSRQFRVAGRGFDVWVPEIRLRLASNDYTAGLDTTIDQGDTHDYPVTYPYDPTPQYPVDLFHKEQTILPGDQEIDPDDRLHPSNEKGNRTDANRPYPGPSPDLFAKGASHRYAEEEPFQGDPYKEWGDDEWHADLPDGPERTFDAGAHHLPGEDDYPGYEQPRYSGGRHEAWEPSSGPNHGGYSPDKPISVPSATERGSYRPAGLSGKYAHVIEPDDPRNPITAFRRDPVEFMQRHAYTVSAGHEDRLVQKFADYDNLLEVEAAHAGGMDKTAAWADVRQKAQRLRHEGRVHVNHVSPQHIYATVDGDHGTYDTMIVKGASGAFSGGQAISNWSCDCDWGKWAFQRQASYVGRLCSHAYAAYLDMQSHSHKGNGGKFKAAGIVDQFKTWAKENNDGHMDAGSMQDFINTCDDQVTEEEAGQLYDHLLKHHQEAPERDYDIPYTLNNDEAYKTAEVQPLRTRPHSLTPDLREVPKGEGNQWTDVTEDDRETTGPEQIVHFGAIAARLHTADLPPGVDPSSVSAADLKAHPDWAGSVQHPSGGGGGAQPTSPTQTRAEQNSPGQQDPSTITRNQPNAPRGPANPLGDLWNTYKNYSQQSPASPPQQGGPVNAVSPAPAPAPGTPGTPGNYPTGPAGINVPHANGGGVFTPDNPNAGTHGMSEQMPGPGGSGAGAVNPQNGVGEVGKGTGYGGAGFQGPNGNGDWLKSNETTKINPGGDYKIQSGDTLNDIAQRSGLSVQDIAKGNNIQDVNKINAGDTLHLPGAAPGADKGVGGVSGDQFKALGDAGSALDDQGKAKPADAGQPQSGPGSSFDNTFKNLGDMAGLPKPPAPPAAPKLPSPSTAAGGTSPVKPGSPADLSTPDNKLSRKSFAYLLHTAAEDDDNDDVDHRPDTGEAASMLERLRDLTEENPSDHYQNMDDYNDEVRDLVEKLNDAGVDAMPIVASSRFAAPQSQRKDSDPSNGDGSFAGQSNPNWADEPSSGSGPDPRYYMSDSASYIDEHERPDFEDVTDLPDGDIIKFNDSRSAPQQGPRHGSLHYADDDDLVGQGTGYFNPDNPTSHDWEEGSGGPFMDEVGHAADQMNPLHGLSGGGEEGGEGGAALAEEAPELVALANRVGRGPAQQVRIDPGVRGRQRRAESYTNAPEDFGNNGEPTLADYSGDAGADPGMGADIVAHFQRSAGALEMMHGQAARAGSLDDFSSSPMVQSMLRTAGRKFSPEEQRMLEAEAHPQGARNLPTDDELAGTHYLL